MKKYITTVLAIFIAAVLFIVFLGRIAISLTDHLNNVYAPLFKENATGVSSPWYDRGYHIVDSRFIEEMSRLEADSKSVIAIGSSVCVIPFHDEIVDEQSQYSYRFMTCGNGSYKSDRILYQLLTEESLIKDSDIIKLEISFSTFREQPFTITETILDKWGKYKVVYEDDKLDSEFRIQRSPKIFDPLYIFNTYLIRIQNMWDLGMDYMDQILDKSHGIGLTERASEFGVNTNGSYDTLIIPGNFRNNYFNPEAVANSLDFSEDIMDETEDLIMDISRDNNLLVELSPLPPNLGKTEFGTKYKNYVESRLIPFLDENDISYVDYRDDYRQDEYADGVHLGYEAGIKYTEKIEEDVNEYAGKIAGDF